MSERHMRKTAVKEKPDQSFGRNLSFAAAEAYKLLRTNLLFALPNENKCRVIGVTSALQGEGKSTTSLNISYMLAELGQKVLLIEADMRLPTIAKRLGIESEPGLSNLLASVRTDRSVIQNSGIHGNLFVMSSGMIPPNPSELLGSSQMKTMIDAMSQSFSFIVLDLPPLGEVSDALVVSKVSDGMVMVVRQNYANRRAVRDALRQLDYVSAKVLGFVVTCAGGQTKGGYKSGYKNKKYGGYYGYDNSKKKKKKTRKHRGARVAVSEPQVNDSD